MPAIKNNCLFEHSMSGSIESVFFFFGKRESKLLIGLTNFKVTSLEIQQDSF